MQSHTQRGLFRFWVLATVFWLAGSSYYFREDLTARIYDRPSERKLDYLSYDPFNEKGHIERTTKEREASPADWEHRERYISLLLLVPVAILFSSIVGFMMWSWVKGGFKPVPDENQKDSSSPTK
jgi:uncharacterized iron-regulated membrane protein